MTQTSKSVKKKTDTVVTLNSTLQLIEIDKFVLQLQESITSKNKIGINAQSVEIIDTASLQLLCAFVNQTKLTGQSIYWIKPSDALITCARLLGLEKHLGIESGKKP